jgi:hypothetical protein
MSTERSTSTLCLERVLFGLAGTVVLTAVSLALLVSPWFLTLAVFAAANQWLYAVAGFCPASVTLRRGTGLAPGCRR